MFISKINSHQTVMLYFPIVALSLATAIFAAEPPAPPVFAARPRLAYTAAELAVWKNDPLRSNEWAAALAQAGAALKADLTVPEKEGQWIFYYNCPKDNARLHPESPDRHVCPACKAVYTDDRTVAAYRTLRNNDINNACSKLALGFAMTGDEQYARPVRAVLLKLAERYPHWERHDRWGRTGLLAVVGGRRYCQHLDEATSIMTLAAAYDLVADAACFSAEDRKAVEENLLKFVVNEIRSFQAFVGSKNNHQTWFNAAYASVGVATADAGLVQAAIYGDCGLLWQLQNSVTEDGLWYEGAMAYHFYALDAIQQTLDAVRRVGWDFSANTRLKSLWQGPLNMAYPDGSIPVFHDSDPASVGGYARYYKWAYGYFKEPVFAAYAGAKAGAGTAAPALRSVAMKGIGVVALRRGSGDSRVCAMLDYGIHGDHHGHPDKLGLVLYALGREWMLDPGRISYSVPEYESWCRTTVAHNTVVIDGENQKPTTGELWFFGETNIYAAALCAADRAYPGYMLKRFLVLTDDLLVDVLAVEGERKATLDWMLHCRGSVTSSLAFKPADFPGKEHGYQHLRSVQSAPGMDSAWLAFKQTADKPLRVILDGDGASTLYGGTGIGYRLNDQVPFVMRRRTGKAAAFVTVYDLSGAGQGDVKVERIPFKVDDKELAEWNGIGLKIIRGASAVIVGLDLRKQLEGAATVVGRPVSRILIASEAVK